MVSFLSRDQARARRILEQSDPRLHFLLGKVLKPGAGSAGGWRFSPLTSYSLGCTGVKSFDSGRLWLKYQLY